ncbi:MAG: ribulose-phosphate 3-epimerase [Alphaproteobacteria bacterium]|nr:ribulose-phosphate 3-epimerase [Alphaproteobacteria bacterium]
MPIKHPKNPVQISASLLSADLLNLEREIESLEAAGADWLHLDIMDGHFVPNLTFGPDLVRRIRKITPLPLDVHLMISPVDTFIDAFSDAGADFITIHPESGPHPHRTVQHIKSRGCKAGLALNPGTPIEHIFPLMDMIDLVLVMSVNPGFGGQDFIYGALKKLSQLRNHLPQTVKLSIDGGINDQTALLATLAGADILVSGNYIFSGKDYAHQINMLRNC